MISRIALIWTNKPITGLGEEKKVSIGKIKVKFEILYWKQIKENFIIKNVKTWTYCKSKIIQSREIDIIKNRGQHTFMGSLELDIDYVYFQPPHMAIMLMPNPLI